MTIPNFPGPGNPQTWRPPAGHPHDPRVDSNDECPICEGPMTGPELCHNCGWEPPEPDYETMIDS